MLGRNTTWRQGSVIPQAEAITAGLFSEGESNSKRAIVITHDCDLTNDKEENVEIIVGEIIDKQNKQFAHARNVRRLHLLYKTPPDDRKTIDLQITDKKSICKSFLCQGTPDHSFVLLDEEKRALKQWLAARYGRPAFPNAFESHLRKTVKKKETVEDQLRKLLESEDISSHLVGIFFDLGQARATELENETPYDLRIIVVYDSTEGSTKARLTATDTATKIQEIFHLAYGEPEVATEIALEHCDAIPDTHFSLSDMRKVDQWRVEHISLHQNPQEQFLAVGEIPT